MNRIVPAIEQPLDGFELRWSADAGHRLVGISTGGFTIRVENGESLEPLLPGAVLEDIQVRRGSLPVLNGGEANVRHVHVVYGLDPHYRVRCAFRHQTKEPAAVATIKDRVLITELMRCALQAGNGIVVQLHSDDAHRIRLASGHIDAEERSICFLQQAPAACAPGDVVRATFETRGHVYSFLTSVRDTVPLQLQLPALLQEAERRRSPRHRLETDQSLMVELQCPLFFAPLLRKIRDLSTSGLSIDADPATDILPSGLVLSQVTIRTSQLEIRCCGYVRHATTAGDPSARGGCGIEFEGLAEEGHARLAGLLMKLRLSGLEEGSDLSFAELWRFFRETGLVDQEKEDALGPVFPEVQRMFELLHAKPSKDFSAVVMRSAGKIVGHVSGIRIYRRTWMFQHLAALRGHNAAPLLNLGALECFAQDSELEYFRLWFLPESRWPNRVFGGIARSVFNREVSQLRSCHPVYVGTDEYFPAAGVDAFEARDADLAVVERYCVEHEPFMLKAEDLSANALGLREVDVAYRRLGLYRKRRIFLATQQEIPVGFALVEISSPGLNLSEALSAFRLFILPTGAGCAETVRRALLNVLLPAYRRTGRRVAVGVVQPEEVETYRDMNLSVGPHWMCWTAHRSLYRRFHDHVDKTFEVLRRRAAASARPIPQGGSVAGTATSAHSDAQRVV